MRLLDPPWLRRHAAGIAIAALLAALLVAPRWWLLASDAPSGVRTQLSPWGADYQGLDETQYDVVAARARAGPLPVRDPMLARTAGAPVDEAFWQQAIGFASRPFGSIFPAIAIAATLGELLGMLLLYAVCRDALRSWLAALVPPVILVVEQVYNQAWGFVQLYHPAVLRAILTVDPQRKFEAFGRFPAPVMLLPPFVGAVLALPRAVDTGSKRWTALSACLVALLVYSYLYYWTALALALGAWLAWLLWRRDFVAARNLAIVGVAATALAAPQLLSLLHGSADLSADVRLRLGIEPAAGIDPTVLARIAERMLVGLPLFWGLRSNRRRDALYVLLYSAPLALLGVQGVLPQTWHFVIVTWDVFALPAVVAGLAGIAARLRPRVSSRLAAPATLALCAFGVAGVLHTAGLQARGAAEVDAAFALRSDEHAAFAWMDGHVRPGQTVVSTSITTDYLLAVLTPASVYVPDGWLTRVSDRELFDRYLRASAAFGYSAADTFGRINPADHSPPYEANFEQSVGYYLTNFEILIDPQRVAARVAALRAAYPSLAASPAPLASYPADYLYCGPRERLWPAVHPAPGTFVRVAFARGEVTVYRIAPASDPAAAPFRGCRA